MNQFLIQTDKSIRAALKKFTEVSSNTLIVVNKNQSYMGTISNGDIRKEIIKNKKLSTKIKFIYNKNSTFYYENNYSQSQISKSFLDNNFDFIPIINKKKK